MVRTLLRKAVFDRHIYLCGSLVRTLLCKVATPPHHGHDFRKRKLPLATAPSCAVSRSKLLLRKTVYCQNFATQNRLQRQRSSLFLTAPFSSGCILCGSLVRTLLCKAAYGSRIYLCGSLFRTLLRKVATPPHLSLRFIKGLT